MRAIVGHQERKVSHSREISFELSCHPFEGVDGRGRRAELTTKISRIRTGLAQRCEWNPLTRNIPQRNETGVGEVLARKLKNLSFIPRTHI